MEYNDDKIQKSGSSVCPKSWNMFSIPTMFLQYTTYLYENKKSFDFLPEQTPTFDNFLFPKHKSICTNCVSVKTSPRIKFNFFGVVLTYIVDNCGYWNYDYYDHTHNFYFEDKNDAILFKIWSSTQNWSGDKQ